MWLFSFLDDIVAVETEERIMHSGYREEVEEMRLEVRKVENCRIEGRLDPGRGGACAGCCGVKLVR